jgi:hypothetical protein
MRVREACASKEEAGASVSVASCLSTSSKLAIFSKVVIPRAFHIARASVQSSLFH